MKRPFALFGFSCLFGALAAFYFDKAILIGSLIVAFVLFIACFFIKHKNKMNFSAMLMAFILSVFGFNFYAYMIYQPCVSYAGKSAEITGYISSTYTTDSQTYGYKVKTTQIGKHKSPVTFNVMVYSSEQLEMFRDIKINVDFYNINNKSNFNENTALRSNCFLTGYINFSSSGENGIAAYNPQKIYLNNDEKYHFEKFFYELSEKGKNAILSSDDKQYSGILNGVITGDKKYISSENQKIYRKSGISHVFAVSGLHLTLMINFLLVLLTKLKVKRTIKCVISMALTLSFMAFVGFSPSINRAGIMMIIYLLGIMFLKDADSLNSLGLSALVILFLNPFDISNVGLILSVFSTLGLITLYPVINKRIIRKLKVKNDIIKAIIGYFSISVSAMVYVIPICVFFFYEVSLISPITNVLITLLVPFIMILGLVICFLGIFNAPLLIIQFLGSMSSFFIIILNEISSFLASLPFATINTQNVFYKFLIVIMFLTIFVFSYKRVSLKRIVKISYVFGITFFVSYVGFEIYNMNTNKITIFEEGKSSAIIAQYKGKNVLISDNLNKTVGYYVSNYIYENSLNEIDFVILTHQNLKSNIAVQELNNFAMIKSITSNDKIDNVNGTHFPLDNIILNINGKEWCTLINTKGETAILFDFEGEKFIYLTEGFDVNQLDDYKDIDEKIKDVGMLIANKNIPDGIDKFNPKNIVLLNRESEVGNLNNRRLSFENKLQLKFYNNEIRSVLSE